MTVVMKVTAFWDFCKFWQKCMGVSVETTASVLAVDGNRKLFQTSIFYRTAMALHLRRPMMLKHHHESLKTNLLGFLFALTL